MIRFLWKKNTTKDYDAESGYDITPEEKDRLMRRIFLNQDGQKLLRILLHDWHFFDLCDTDRDRALNEYAKEFVQYHLGRANITIYSEIGEKE